MNKKYRIKTYITVNNKKDIQIKYNVSAKI